VTGRWDPCHLAQRPPRAPSWRWRASGGRRRVLHFNVTANPSAEWTSRQLLQTFPEEMAPRILVRDRDGVYGDRIRHTLDVLRIEEVITAARSPWQNAFAERLIGSLRRECLDHSAPRRRGKEASGMAT